MTPEVKQRTILVALLLVAWTALACLKTALPAAIPDLERVLAVIQFLVPMAIGYHAGASTGVLPALPAPTAPAAASTQSGFVRLRFLLALVLVVSALCLAACAAPPTPTQVDQIRMACAVDAGIRPAVTEALAIPGLAKPEEIDIVNTARAIIDPICKDPTKPVIGADPYVVVTQASAQITGVLMQLQVRKAQAK